MGSWIVPPTFRREFHDEGAVRRTNYRLLGNTDMVVSKLALGGGPFGGLFGPFENPTSIVVEALRLGINYIDTAYWYGQGRSEEALGRALCKVPRGAYYMATKVGRYEQDYGRMFDFRAERVLESVEQSLRRLGLSYVDVIQVQIHDLEFAPSLEMILNETLPALASVVYAGKARYIGITGYPLDKLREVIERSSVKIDLVLSYSRGMMTDSSLCDFIPFCKERRIGIVNAAVTGMGLLTPQGPPSWHPAPEKIKDACAAARKHAADHGVDIARLATHYGTNLPGVQTTVSGAHTLEVLQRNLETTWYGLSTAEDDCTREIMSLYFNPLQNAHWEGIEVRKYWRKNQQKPPESSSSKNPKPPDSKSSKKTFK